MSEQAVAVPAAIDADFCFINTGDSMINARIFDGDSVFIRQQNTAESGDIIVFLYQEETRIGVFSSGPNYIAFTPANPQYPSLTFFDEEKGEVEIIGKAVAFLASIQSQKETRSKPPQTES